MQSKLNTPISRRYFLAAAGLSMTCMLTTGCSITVSSKSSNESEKSPIALIGAYHPLTGMSDPQDLTSDADLLAEAEQNLREGEAGDDTKIIFVLAEVTPDTKKNLELHSNRSTTGATLTVDGTNSYNDCYGLNKRDWFELLTQLGFHNGTSSKTLYAGSSENYKQVFLFLVGKNDLENGKTANVKWDDLTLSFEISQIQEVATPRDMVAQLQG